MKERLTTTAPVKPTETSRLEPEWCRLRDLEKAFGIRRGTAYALMRDGKIRSCLLRAQGRVSGLRLIHVKSVRDFIESQMKQDAVKEFAE